MKQMICDEYKLNKERFDLKIKIMIDKIIAEQFEVYCKSF